MVRDFFEFLKNVPDKDYYLALGSNQRVKVEARFQPKAKKAYNRYLEAIANEGKTSANEKWREVFGTLVPLEARQCAHSFDNTEEFIEQKYPVDVQYTIAIDCTVTQNGWRPASLREMLKVKSLLLANKELDFAVIDCNVPTRMTAAGRCSIRAMRPSVGTGSAGRSWRRTARPAGTSAPNSAATTSSNATP